ncbi:alpha-galactosidase [Streptomyces brasiliensis]|uniref:Alpha-galactosidase n=1 Tax=Streptomyces brasiliensis TaxID=1954 RepID=A0A917NEP9_9ACTN|nr:alpha-galactosidase [Streptomyces brasiliensis]GGI95856.1 alpha-galactosidase [Streptomyces brasiliensis]
MTPYQRWTLRTDATSYTVRLSADGPWAELDAWGPHGVETGPSALDWSHRTHFFTPADAAPAEYLPYGLRPFTGADLVASRPGEERGVWWEFAGAEEDEGALRLAFTDEVLGLRTVLCYRTVPGTDVILRWTEFTSSRELRLERLDSAAVTVPVTGPARLTYLTGQWSQEFQHTRLDLSRGTFSMGSTQGAPGHAYAPWLAVQDGENGPAYGVALEWPGNWHLTAQAEPGGFVRVRAGRVPHEGAVYLTPGETLTTPRLACAFSAEGLDGLSRVWHRYERHLSGERLRRPRKVLYNSWEATAFDVDAAGQLELAKTAADIGAELFVVDDGWFTGRADDTGGLGDWYPDPAAFPDGFGRFVDDVRALGLDFGLWIEPEAVSPGSELYAEHPDWVYRIEDRPARLVRNQLLLDLGRTDVQDFVIGTLDRLLTEYDISYLKWDMNRPPTERSRPGAGPADRLDLDAQHVAGYLHVLDHLRSAHPHVTVEGCAGGGARVDHATLARTDVLWPSDNTAPLDRLAIQYGFLHAHAPHVMSSWVTDAPGVFDPRSRSLAFRFVNAMCGVLGIGADLRHWDADQRAEAARWIARYKDVRDVVHLGEARLLGSPRDVTCGVQYDGADGRTVVAALSTGPLDGAPLVPGRPARLRLRGLDAAATYRDADSGAAYSGAHLLHYGLPFAWSAAHDAELVVLTRE